MSHTQPTHAPLLHAAIGLLESRQHGMLTAQEWRALANAVSELTGQPAEAFLTEQDHPDASDERIHAD